MTVRPERLRLSVDHTPEGRFRGRLRLSSSPGIPRGVTSAAESASASVPPAGSPQTPHNCAPFLRSRRHQFGRHSEIFTGEWPHRFRVHRAQPRVQIPPVPRVEGPETIEISGPSALPANARVPSLHWDRSQRRLPRIERANPRHRCLEALKGCDRTGSAHSLAVRSIRPSCG